MELNTNKPSNRRRARQNGKSGKHPSTHPSIHPSIHSFLAIGSTRLANSSGEIHYNSKTSCQPPIVVSSDFLWDAKVSTDRSRTNYALIQVCTVTLINIYRDLFASSCFAQSRSFAVDYIVGRRLSSPLFAPSLWNNLPYSVRHSSDRLL